MNADYLFGDSRVFGVKRKRWETKDFVDEAFDCLRNTNKDSRLNGVFDIRLPKGKPGTYIKREIISRILGDNKLEIDPSETELLKVFKDGYVSTTPENLENLRSNFKMHEKEWMPLK